MSSERYFFIGALSGGIAAFLTFIGSWIYCIATYGYLFGVGLGWLPSMIVAAVVYGVMYVAWPIVAFGAAGLALYLYGTIIGKHP